MFHISPFIIFLSKNKEKDWVFCALNCLCLKRVFICEVNWEFLKIIFKSQQHNFSSFFNGKLTNTCLNFKLFYSASSFVVPSL